MSKGHLSWKQKAAYLIALFEQYDVPYKMSNNSNKTKFSNMIGKKSDRTNISDMAKNVCIVRCYVDN